MTRQLHAAVPTSETPGADCKARLRKMSDDDLIRFGKASRSLCRHRDCPDTFKRQLQEASAEWRRRHPKAQ